MISKPGLNLDVFRVPNRTRLELIRRFLERGVQRAPNLPSQAAPLNRSATKKSVSRVGIQFPRMKKSTKG